MTCLPTNLLPTPNRSNTNLSPNFNQYCYCSSKTLYISFFKSFVRYICWEDLFFSFSVFDSDCKYLLISSICCCFIVFVEKKISLRKNIKAIPLHGSNLGLFVDKF